MKMAASIRVKLFPYGRALRLHTAAEVATPAAEVATPAALVATPAAEAATPAAEEATPAVPTARYPPVVASLTAKSKAARQRRVDRWHQQAHDAPSVEAKLRVLTKLQRPKYVVHPQTFALNADRWYQSFTKTVYLSGLPLPRPPGPGEPGGLPDLAPLRSAVCDCLLQEHFHLKRKKRAPLYQQQEFVASPFLYQLVTSLTGLLTPHNPSLSAAALDFQRPVHFYWWCGEEVIEKGYRKGRIDALRYQINDKPHSQIRIQKQLSEFVPLDYSVPIEIPVINCKPDKLPLFKRQYENNIFIGTRLADPCCYGHTQFHLLPDKLKRERLLKNNRGDQIEVGYRANAIASLFAWTGAQAMYQGFWSEADVTRPFVSQGVVTDGKYFAFFCYQLNTLALTAQADRNNSRKNICWGTESKPLFEVIEDGDVKGFNDELLLQLIQFIMNRPEEHRSQLL